LGWNSGRWRNGKQKNIAECVEAKQNGLLNGNI
jgi:hypothetical protein